MAKSVIRITQEGYKFVARFKDKEQADARAELYRELGHEAEVVPVQVPQGSLDYIVYLKIKEV